MRAPQWDGKGSQVVERVVAWAKTHENLDTISLQLTSVVEIIVVLYDFTSSSKFHSNEKKDKNVHKYVKIRKNN